MIKFRLPSRAWRPLSAVMAFALMQCCFVFSCTRKSDVKTIRSDDWFRNGVDRLYLATVPTSVRLAGQATARVGQEVLVGLGCFGEPKDPATPAVLAESSCAPKMARLPLNERIRLQDFPLAADPKNPKAGECVLLLGPSELVNVLRTRPEKLADDGFSTAAVSAATATNACGLSLALGTSFLLQKTAVSGQSTSSADAVRFARKMLNYFGENNLVPGSYTEDYPVYALKSNENLRGKTPAELARIDKVLVGQAVLPCGVYSKSVWDLFGVASRNDVRKVFFTALAEADRRAALRIRQGGFFGSFAEALQRGDLRAAAGVYNPIFAYEFNRNVDAKASQGWGGFGSQKFFDEIRKINLELLAL